MEFIRPVWADIPCGIFERSPGSSFAPGDSTFIFACLMAEKNYKDLLEDGWRPEQAREVLPNALKTEIVVTANLREWRHIFRLRCSKAAHPQMRALMMPCLQGFADAMPAVFDDIITDLVK